MGTAAFFNKSLKNICFTKRSLSKKTAQMTDDLVEAILIRDVLVVLLRNTASE